MAKLTGPLLSFGATGQIGKAMVTGKWRGIDYARSYVIPANPRTTAQQTNRSRFANLREIYKLSSAEIRAPWDAFATGRRFVGSNAFVGENNRALVGETDFSKALFSPGARGGLPPQSVTATTGTTTGSVDVAFSVPNQLPSGWTIKEAVACAFPEQDPTERFGGPLVSGIDATAPYSITLTGLPPGELCAVFGWLVYEKPSGELAYSVSLYDSATADT